MRLYRLWRSRVLSPQITQFARRVSRFLPPFVSNALHYLISEWEYLPQGWQRERAPGDGWSDATVAEAQERQWPTLVRNLRGPGPLGVSHFLRSETREDRGDHNTMMSFAYVLARAARKKDSLSVLDWGGFLDHYRLYSAALLPEVTIDCHCFEVSRLCDVGRRLQPQARFYDDEAEVLSRRYDYVLLAPVPRKDGGTLINASIKQAHKLPRTLAKSLTWDRGKGMADHRRFSLATDIQACFGEPQCPWQRGSNENTNGLLGQHLPKRQPNDSTNVVRRPLETAAQGSPRSPNLMSCMQR